MLNVREVAEQILRLTGPISSIKLQKLVYYSQAWSLAWDEAPLFEEEIEAWANGPVIRELYASHRGRYIVQPGEFGDISTSTFTPNQLDTIQKVVSFYGDKSPQWLSDLTHNEDPWIKARVGLEDGERGQKIISKEDMLEYYSSL